MKNNKTSIVIMGDSNTAGYGLASPEESYPYKLNKMLGKEFSVHNFGVSGSCVINTTYKDKQVGMPYVKEKAYNGALKTNGDIFIINLGTNDAQDGIDDNLPIVDEYSNLIKYRSRFTDDYIQIIEDIKSLHPKSKIIICIPIPVMECIWRKHQEKYLLQLISCFEYIQNKYSDIGCIDLHSEFTKLEENDIKKMYLDDGLHLNSIGTDYVSEIIANFIMNPSF